MGLGAAVAGVSAVVGAGAQIYSANKASKAQENAAAQSDATQRYFYDTTRADYAPYREAGYSALGSLQDLYGLPRTGSASSGGTGVDWAAFVKADPWRVQDWSANYPNMSIEEYGRYNYQYDMNRGRALDPNYKGFDLAPYTSIGSTSGSASGKSPTEIIAATPGYQFRKQEGLDAIKANMSARGLLGSTATSRMMDRYAEGLAASEYDAYANRLAAMAGIGQSATGSVAAAGQGAANAISTSQRAAGDARASAYANTGSAINNGVQNLASAYLYGRQGGFGGGAYGIPGSDGIY